MANEVTVVIKGEDADAALAQTINRLIREGKITIAKEKTNG